MRQKKLFDSIAFITFALAMAGCSHHEAPYKGPPLYMIYSPNGEPLNGGPLGSPTCEQAISHWFDRLSSGHEGMIPQSVFMRDAQMQFNKMDIDHNGYIVSEELDRYRQPYRQQPGLSVAGGTDETQTSGRHSHKKGAGGGADSKTLQADISFTSADSVMSADTNLDFRVTPEEFMTQAQGIFATLDSNHDGALSRAETAALCKPHNEKP